MGNYLQKIKRSKDKFLENHFFRPRWYSVLFNPYFISRYFLYYRIKTFAKDIRPDDNVLDIGCGIKPYRKLFRTSSYVGIDIQGGGHADQAKCVDKFYDGKTVPYNNEMFSVAICTQVLEHAELPEALVREAYRVLAKGGRFLLSVPLTGNEHEIPYDFRRFTQYGIKKLLEECGFEVVVILPTCGVFGVCGQLISAFIFESMSFRNTLIKSLLSLFILAPVQILSLALDWITSNRWVTLDYVAMAKK